MRPFRLATVVAMVVAMYPMVGRAEHALRPKPSDLGGGAPLPADTVKRLRSGQPSLIRSALDDIRISGRAGAAAVPAVVDLLRQGISPTLTLAALETLGDTESPAASDVVAWYTRHKNIALRRAAVEALVKTGGGVATKALKAALSDSDVAVRGLSATGLGTLKAKDAVPELFAALERHVPEAAASIGELCAAPDCEHLASKLGTIPFDVVASGLDEVLLRPPGEVSDDVKVKIVDSLREVGTAEVNHFLKRVQARLPAHGWVRVKHAIDQTVLATAGSPGSDGAEVGP
ncbi:MAG: HEAT repeat domain-containing protein [Polyangiaceae bacterium]